MTHFLDWLKETLFIAAFMVVAIIALLFIGVVAMAARSFLLISLVAAALGCYLLARFSPRFRRWFESAGQYQT